MGTVFVHPGNLYLYANDPSTTPGTIRLYKINPDKSLSFVNAFSGMSGVSYDNGCFDRSGRFLFLTKSNATGMIQVIKIADDMTPSPVASLTTGNTLMECVTSIDSYSVWP